MLTPGPLELAHRRFLDAVAETARLCGGPDEDRHSAAVDAEMEARRDLLADIALAAGFDLDTPISYAHADAEPVVAWVREGRHLFMVAVGGAYTSEDQPYRPAVAEGVFPC